MIGAALAMKDAGWGQFQVFPAILCFLFAFIMQIDSNFINDYFDCIKGNDEVATRLGPRRACAEGWITLKAMRIGILITTALGCVVGLPLIFFGGWEMVAVGAVCVLAAFLYTTKLSYLGMGDMLVLVFFGITPVCLTYYVILPSPMQTVTWQVLLCSIGCGFVIDTLLIVNNFRDRDNDRRDGKQTLIVRVGEQWGARLYLIMGQAGALITLLAIWPETYTEGRAIASLFVMLYVIYATLHHQTHTHLKQIWEGRELNKVLGMTARNMLVYGLITVVFLLAVTFIS